ncbi:MAG TPA: NAD(P)/FAD-dependent oxidoreductase, partial [Accumulibacter sp.]|nr:NAD(P)/FAD-dependent oxidoreductase [Accumulibacter sp.]
VHGLGVDTFVGSSGRVFPTEMKAAPLLRAWLQRLRASGVRFHMRHRWCGWAPQPNASDARDGLAGLRFATPHGERQRQA